MPKLMSDSFPLSTIRHSTAHVLAQAVLKLYPTAKLGIGPAIEDGFYYDFDLEKTLSDEDLHQIESIMKAIISEKQSFTHSILTNKNAKSVLQTHQQDYKLELLSDLNLDEYSFYTNGPFTDLCKGPHIDNTSQIKAFKLLKVSGAYWKGSEKNKMLQRIYGTAFETKSDLDHYLHQLEEAKKRDHRVLGTQLDLFSINNAIGSGLILWHPKGAKIRHVIEQIWKSSHINEDYELIYSPHIGKQELWAESGHLENYKEFMFASMEIDKSEYFTKPMNCPFHILVYQSKHRSYKELPIKYAELGTVYRYERSGVLHGLMRVRGFTQDDAHIICRPEQVNEEIKNVLSFCISTLQIFEFTEFSIFIATQPPEKSVGNASKWELATQSLIEAVQCMDLPYQIDQGGGAFYGPKIDIKIKDAIGREWQCSTIQFDFNLPEKFNMSYINSEGQKETPIMIHRALLGSLERFFGILIEHYAGKFPFFLAPSQIVVLPIKMNHIHHAKELTSQLKSAGFRVDIDQSDEKIGYKIRHAITQKIPYMIILGDKEIESKVLSVRSRDDGQLDPMHIDQFMKYLNSKYKKMFNLNSLSV